MAETMDLFYAIDHCRAMRRLKPDPVPEALLIRLIRAGHQGPSGSNRQNSRWIVVRDPEQKRRLAALNKKHVDAYVGRGAAGAAHRDARHQDEARQRRLVDAVRWQAEHLHEAPGADRGLPEVRPAAARHLSGRRHYRRLPLAGGPEPAAGRAGAGPGRRPHHPATQGPRRRPRGAGHARHDGAVLPDPGGATRWATSAPWSAAPSARCCAGTAGPTSSPTSPGLSPHGGRSLHFPVAIAPHEMVVHHPTACMKA